MSTNSQSNSQNTALSRDDLKGKKKSELKGIIVTQSKQANLLSFKTEELERRNRELIDKTDKQYDEIKKLKDRLIKMSSDSKDLESRARSMGTQSFYIVNLGIIEKLKSIEDKFVSIVFDKKHITITFGLLSEADLAKKSTDGKSEESSAPSTERKIKYGIHLSDRSAGTFTIWPFVGNERIHAKFANGITANCEGHRVSGINETVKKILDIATPENIPNFIEGSQKTHCGPSLSSFMTSGHGIMSLMECLAGMTGVLSADMYDRSEDTKTGSNSNNE